MNKFLITLFLIIITHFTSSAQNKELDNYAVWAACYPSNTNFDGDALIRKLTKNGVETTYKAEVSKKLYYTISGVAKVVAIIYNFNYADGEKEDCHGCHPLVSIARFRLNKNSWTLEKFEKEFKGFYGSWGDGPEVSLKKINGIFCLTAETGFTNQGTTKSMTEIYNAETLKKTGK